MKILYVLFVNMNQIKGKEVNMKANDGSGNNEWRDTWETPQKLWDQLNEQYKFNFELEDCCGDCYKSFKKWLKYRKNN